MFDNLEIIFEMNSPIATTGYVHFDAILSAAKAKEILGEQYYNFKPTEKDLYEIDIPLNKKYGVWCGSVGIGDNREFVSSWSKRWDNQNDDIVNLNEKGKQRVDIGSGHFKSYHMPLIVKSYKDITFYANGNSNEIERLIKTHINFIGKKSSQGYGEIRNIIINKIKEDYSCFKNDKPTKFIPVSNYEGYLEYCIKNNIEYRTDQYSISPPYWRTDMLEMCYCPII